MNDTRKHFEDMAEHRSATHAASFLQRLGMDSHGEFVYTGVRSDWMEQDGPAIPVFVVSDAFGRLLRMEFLYTDLMQTDSSFCFEK